MSRPFVSVYDLEGQVVEQASIPEVLNTPIRPDHVRYVHTQLSKNHRQPYAVSMKSGYQCSAESWGTGRAVARIPRASGGGTHRAGQGAFGNMCRGGGMYAPTRTWRRWHRKVNLTEKRHAVASCLAAASCPSLVLARGHRVEAVPELPLVISGLEGIHKTKDAQRVMEKVGLKGELLRVKNSKQIRAGKGKMRNRRYRTAVGPLVVHACERQEVRGFQNLPGVELCHVSRLNPLRLAPGGNMGRLMIFTKDAFSTLKPMYESRANYTFPRSLLTTRDVRKVIKSQEVQAALRPALESSSKPRQRKQNLLRQKHLIDPACVQA